MMVEVLMVTWDNLGGLENLNRAAGAGPVPGEVSLVWHYAQLQRPLLRPSQLRQDAARQDPLLETLKRCLFCLNIFHYIYCL